MASQAVYCTVVCTAAGGNRLYERLEKLTALRCTSGLLLKAGKLALSMPKLLHSFRATAAVQLLCFQQLTRDMLCCAVHCCQQSPQEGEIVAYKVSDGDPVEYGGPIVALAPYFNLEDAGKTQLRGLN